jgi:hypothetical protein
VSSTFCSTRPKRCLLPKTVSIAQRLAISTVTRPGSND